MSFTEQPGADHDRTLFFVVMVKSSAPPEQDAKIAERMRDAVHLQYNPTAQVTFMGDEDQAVDALRGFQQRLLERRQRESRS
jgi:hypothetical protein